MSQTTLPSDLWILLRDMQAQIDALNRKQQNPIGVVLPFGGKVIPPGYLLCDHAEYDRTTYDALWSVIGANFGNGNGSTTFNVPSAQDAFLLGAGAVSLGASGGESEHMLTAKEIPSHTHNVIETGQNLGTVYSAGGSPLLGWNATYPNAAQSQASSSVGGDLPHNNMPPYLALNFIIAAI